MACPINAHVDSDTYCVGEKAKESFISFKNYSYFLKVISLAWVYLWHSVVEVHQGRDTR